VENAEAMIWKLLTVVRNTWRKLNAPGLLKMFMKNNASKMELP